MASSEPAATERQGGMGQGCLLPGVGSNGAVALSPLQDAKLSAKVSLRGKALEVQLDLRR